MKNRKADQSFFDEVNLVSLNVLESLLYEWFPDGRVVGREFLCGDWAGNAGDSLSINVDTGKGGDFAAGDMVGDPVGIYSKRFGVDRVDALRALAGLLHVDGGDYTHDDNKKFVPAVVVKTNPDDTDEKKRERVSLIVSQCQPLKGTPAARYLKEVRKLERTNLQVFQYRPHRLGGGALVCLAKDVNGVVQAVQQVYLSPDGQKIHDPWSKTPTPKKPVTKRTNGFAAGNPVRIPAKRADTPIIVCEGPEDGITLNNATGFEVWITCGVVFMDKIPLIPGRQYIIARDNDEPDSDADIRMNKALATLLDRGFDNLLCARPPESVKDANKLLQDVGMEAVVDMINQAQPVIDFRQIEPLAHGPVGFDDQGAVYAAEETSIFEKCADLGHNDQGNLARIRLRWGEKVKYVEGIGWHIYKRGQWSNYLAHSRVVQMIQATHYEIINEARFVDDHKKAAIKAWWRKSQNWPTIRNSLSLIQHNLTLGVDQLDSNIFYFNVENGVIDLRTGKLLTHKAEQYLTKQSGIRFDPDAKCPVWERFLNEIFPKNPEIIPFIQRAVGYSLTGDTSEQCMFILHGHGANGKSTFLDTLQGVLGDYWQKTKSEAFMERGRVSDANPFIAVLRGARFVTASETKSDRSLDESLIKETTGDNFITVRNMYQSPFTFAPQFKLWIATNHKPEIKGTDEGIWRRLRLVPFHAHFYDNEDVDAPNGGPFRDKLLMVKLKAELPGILTWAVQGCLEWQRKGLQPPFSVQEATQEYRREMDILGSFFEDCCEFKTGTSCTCKELYEIYRRWCDDNGHLPLSKSKLGRRIYERGVNKGEFRHAKIYEGISIRKDSQENRGWQGYV